MASVAPASQTRESHKALVTVAVLLMAAMTWFVAQKAHYLTDYSLASYTEYFWPRRIGLVVHLVGGMLALVTGITQIWLGSTRRTGPLHRLLGKVYASSILVASCGGFYLAFTISGPPAYRTGLIFLNVAWLITTGMALYSIRRRLIEQHREWMLRSYVVTFAFVTYRMGENLLRRWITVPDTPNADDIAIMMAWACWAVPLLLAEPLIQLRSMRRFRRSSPSR
jgi:uncharacterized membrane protein